MIHFEKGEKMKRILAILVLVILAILLITKIGLINKNSEKAEKNRKKFGASFMTLNNPYFVELKEGLKDVIESNGDKLISLDPQLDIQKQIAVVEDLIEQKVDGIFLNPTDWKAIRPALESAKKAGIPVYVVDAPVYDEALVKTTVVSDNWNAGTLCALHLTQTLGITKGNIVILEHPSAKSAMERTDSFLQEISKYPNLKVIAKKSSDGQLEIAMSIMEKIIKENGEITAIMAENDPTALGVIAALERSGKLNEVKAIYGVDGSSDALTLIRTGKLTATVAQYPKEIGRIAAETAYKSMKGEEVPKEIKVPVKLLTKDNLE